MPRVLQHKSGAVEGFTQRYHINRLVYYEAFHYVNNAIARETQIKKWRREKRVALIEATNPAGEDLASDWGKPTGMRKGQASEAVLRRADSSPTKVGSE